VCGITLNSRFRANIDVVCVLLGRIKKINKKKIKIRMAIDCRCLYSYFAPNSFARLSLSDAMSRIKPLSDRKISYRLRNGAGAPLLGSSFSIWTCTFTIVATHCMFSVIRFHKASHSATSASDIAGRVSEAGSGLGDCDISVVCVLMSRFEKETRFYKKITYWQFGDFILYYIIPRLATLPTCSYPIQFRSARHPMTET
jgi:hypothetical protein